MQQQIITGTIQMPKTERQRKLYRQLGDFANWMQRAKDASEVQKDKRKSVPISQLPMVF